MATRKPSNPNAVAIHAVAKAANVSSRELMDTIEQWDLGWDATNHMKRLSPEQIREVEKRLEVEIYDELQAEEAKRAAARRARSKKSRAKAKPAPKSTPKTKADEKTSDDKPKQKAEKDAGKADKQQAETEEKAPKQRAKPDEKKAVKDDKSKAEKKEKKEKKGAQKKSEAKPAKKDAKGEDKKSRAPKDKRSERDDTSDAPKLTPEEIPERARAILADILEGMGFAHPRISVDVGPRAVRISVSGRGIAEILGQRNASADVDVLEALQLVVQKSLFGNDHRHGPAVAIDIMGFREGRQQELRAMANRMAEYVARTGKVLRVAGMNFIDRRAVHQGLYDNKEARTESVGHGAMRSLEVSKGKADGRKNTGRRDQSASDDDRNDDASNKRSRGKRGPKSDASDKKGPSKDAGGKSSADKGDASDE